MATDNTKCYDYVVIGSGFGGSVAAMRLAEKGYSVLVLEKGRRWEAHQFPHSDWRVSKYLWAPALRWFGFLKLTFFRKVFVLTGVGVGGGSLVYANTHMVPPDEFFDNPAWAHLSPKGGWKAALAPYYALARRMLGSVPHLGTDVEDEALRRVARSMGKEESFGPVQVGVYFGDTRQPTDPYFGGLGPLRTGCTRCAGCMVGCKHGAKNTLDKNYLYFAEQWGTRVLPETLATRIEQQPDGSYRVHTRSATGGWWRPRRQQWQAKGLVVCGGVLGTLDLLMRQKYEAQTLTHLSAQLGANLRTNSEMLCGATLAPQKMNHGIAISSVFNPDNRTHIEIVKFPDGSGALGALGTLATGPGTVPVRVARYIGNIATQPWRFLRVTFNRRFASNSVILLVMQSLDNAMAMRWRKRWWQRRGSLDIDNSANGGGAVPSYIEAGQQTMLRYAKEINGTPINAITEITLGMATTAHILGGCPMGATSQEGVVNKHFEVHGYPNMYILDGSIIPCNLGVNPSLTITALSEYAMSNIANKPGYTGPTLDERIAQLSNSQ